MKMFNIPNLFTAGNMLCGVAAILLTFAGQIGIAPYFVFLAAVLDFLDGFLARLLKQQGELGKQLDSLADMISFGLAPGLIMLQVLISSTTCRDMGTCDYELRYQMYQLLDKNHGVAANFQLWVDQLFHRYPYEASYLPFFALLIPFFSMFRLAKFNIDTRQSESFIGLPTPANTIFFMAFPLLLTQYADSTGWEHDLIMKLIHPFILIPIIVVMSLLLVSELPLFALKFKSFKWKGNEIRYVFLISCGILIPLLLFWSVPIIILLYLLLSLINNIIRKKQTHEIQS